MTVNKDSVKDGSKLIADFKHIITEDNAAACVVFTAVWMAQKLSRVQFPLVEELWQYPSMEVLDDTDGVTLKQNHRGLPKTCLNIPGAVNSSPIDKREIDRNLLSCIVSLVVSAMSIATWPEFQAALDAAPVGVVAEKDVKEAYHWLSARETGCWNDVSDMGLTWRQHCLDMRSPVI